MCSEEYLYHHGIKGMKWGVRRYQNADGSLTAAGQKRYNDDGSRKSSATKKYERKAAIGRESASEWREMAKSGNAFSAKAAGHKLAAKVYGLNEKAYSKSNKTLASMNRSAKNDALKKAQAAQEAANAKRADRYEKNARSDEAYAAKMESKLAASKRMDSARNQVEKASTAFDRINYNRATREAAAKYVAKQNMPVSDAIKKAKGKAWRNTAILVGAYAAVSVASLRSMR